MSKHLRAGGCVTPGWGTNAVLVTEPHVVVRADACSADRTAGLDDRGEHAVTQVDPYEAVRGVVVTVHQQGLAVGEPVRERHRAREIQRDLSRGSLPRRPHEGPRESADLAEHHEALVARHRGPPGRDGGHPFVGDLADRVTRARVEDAHRRVLDVRPLGVPDRDERSVRRQTAGSLRPILPRSSRLLVAVDLPAGLRPVTHDDRVAVVVGEARGDGVTDERESRHPHVGQSGEERPRISTCEGRDHPPPSLVALRIEPPDDARAVGGDVCFLSADTLGGRLSAHALGEIPRPRLRDATLRRDDGEPMWGGPAPRDVADGRHGQPTSPIGGGDQSGSFVRLPQRTAEPSLPGVGYPTPGR